jgi:L-asparaginase
VDDALPSLGSRTGKQSSPLLILLALLAFTGPSLARATEPAVAVLYGSVWSPGDAARDGAAEFEVLMCVAQVQHASSVAGLVSVGYRRGSFPPSAETALERVAHMGIPVVRLAQTSPLPTHHGDSFIEAGSLSPADAKRLLTECLVRYGSLPVAADPAKPTKKEDQAFQTKLALFQAQFDARNLSQVAMR